MQIDKIKEKKPGKKGLKERAASVPKQLLRRGLDDGTERLRGQLRDASQRGQRDDYGGDRIEDTAWAGGRWAGCGIGKLLKKRDARDRGPEVEPVPSADSPDTKLPLDAPPEPAPQRSGTDRVRIKTREAAMRQGEGFWRASGRKSDPAFATRPVSEKPPHARAESPKIKTREYVRRDVFTHGDAALSPVESPMPERSPPFQTPGDPSAFPS